VRLIKLGLISAVFLFLVATAISLMIPSHIRISKAINIKGEEDSIFSLVKDESRWREWHPAFMPNPSAKKFPPILIVSKIQNDSQLVMQMKQGDKKPVTSTWQIYHHQSTDSLTLQWYMDFRLSWYPWQKFGSLFYENTYGAMMEQGLSNIKTRSEN
jgi:hypothetical protein